MRKFSFILTSSVAIMALAAGMSLITSCEGPAGLTGDEGADANETCKLCHNQSVVGQKMAEFKFSKHHYGEAAFEEAGSTGCAPCHASEGFKYVSENNIPATFALNATTGKYSNSYSATSSTSYGEFSCATCHSNLHNDYEFSDFYPLTTTAPVAMNMWGGTKTIDVQSDSSSSNLCIKCHQPRPITTSSTLSTGNVVNYAALATNPTATFFAPGASTNVLLPSYRTGVHYGTAGAIYAGEGGVEFDGSLDYTNGTHTATASCSDCHMAPITGRAGGHTFVAKGNFNGCNTAECHGSAPLNANSTKFKDTQTAIKTLLNNLAGQLKTVDNIDILHKDSDAESNLWASATTNKYDGYFDIYDPSTNPEGALRNPGPASSWTQAQKDINLALPAFTLTNAEMGALINFQMCLRDYSLGVHNYAYTRALLTNSLEALAASK